MTDDELIGIFADEASVRLAALADGLLRLETGLDPQLVDDLFREAHTIKGAAAVVGFDDVSGVAHVMEDLLQGLRAGTRQASAALVDELLHAVDGLREVIAAALAGKPDASASMALRQRVETFRDSSAPSQMAPSPPSSAVPPGGGPADPPPGLPVPPVAPASPPPPLARTEALPSAGSGEGERAGETLRVPLARLDALVRLVGESAAANLRVERLLIERLGAGAADLEAVRDLSRSLAALQETTMRARMVPVSTVVEPLRRAVRDIGRDLDKQVAWVERGIDTELDRNVLAQLADPLLHLVRNAVGHGIEDPDRRRAAGKPPQGTVTLHAMQIGTEVVVAVSDDGAGIDVAAVRAQAEATGISAGGDDDPLQLVFRPGLSTADRVSHVSGRGVGLDLVRFQVESLRGRVEVHSTPGSGTEFRVRVPITLAVLPCLLVRVGDQRYALPMHSVVVIARSDGEALVWIEGAPVPVARLGEVLGTGPGTLTAGSPVVVVAGRTRRHGFAVDELLGERAVVVKGLPGLVTSNDVLTGASVEPDGSVICVLHGAGIVERAREGVGAPAAAAQPGARRQRSLLVVDDALTVRELQRSILERAGYEVRTASDGTQALALLAERPSDLVLTDVEMPLMDGFALTEAIRSIPSLATVPVIILTSRSTEEDRRKGLEAGADGYLLKSAFDGGGLVAAVERLLGSAQ